MIAYHRVRASSATPAGPPRDTPGANGTGILAVATVNVGAGASITAPADTGSESPPLTIALCQTDPATGGAWGRVVPFDPASTRIFLWLSDGSGTTRGPTSAAVRTR